MTLLRPAWLNVRPPASPIARIPVGDVAPVHARLTWWSHVSASGGRIIFKISGRAPVHFPLIIPSLQVPLSLSGSSRIPHHRRAHPASGEHFRGGLKLKSAELGSSARAFGLFLGGIEAQICRGLWARSFGIRDDRKRRSD